MENKKYIRKILFALLILGILGCGLWYGWQYVKANDPQIKQVKIFATYEHLEKNSIQKIVTSHLNQGFFHLNTTRLKQELLKLPWVYAVSIKREWPNSIKINIAEQNAILQWGKTALFNPEGQIFSPPPATFPRDLPVIFGPEEKQAEIFSLYQKMLAVLFPLDLSLSSLTLNHDHYWELILSTNTIIYLKEEQPIEQLELLTNIYRKITADRDQEPKSIDLRYQTGLAVRW